jgi:hypothetical protein
MTRFGTGRRGLTGGAATLVAAFLALSVWGVGTAAAATPIDLGAANSNSPGMALLPSGGAALTWSLEDSVSHVDTLHYCRVDPGGVGCAAANTFTSPLPTFTGDHGSMPLVDGAKVRVIETRALPGSTQDRFLWTGEPFGSSTTLGTTSKVPGSRLDFGDALLAPAGTLNASNPVIAAVETGPNSSEGPIVSASNLTENSGDALRFHVTEESVSDTAISLQGSMLSAAWISQSLTQSGAVLWRRYLTGGGTPQAIQEGKNWSTPVKIGQSTVSSRVQMASGPKGLYVAYLSPDDGAVEVQHFNGLGFDPPVTISEASVNQFAISEDPAGLLHLAYSTSSGNRYSYAKDASNASFSRPQTLPAGSPTEMRIATDAAGNGWLSWHDIGNGHDFVLALAPGEPPLPAPPAGGGGGGGGGAPPAKKAGKAPQNVTFGALGHGLVGELSVPKECVPGGQVFKAKVGVKRKGSQAHKASYTVKKVAFFLGAKKIATDKRKPFEVGFATKGVGAGRSLTVAAKISVDLHIGHRHSTVAKTLKTTVRTCK